MYVQHAKGHPVYSISNVLPTPPPMITLLLHFKYKQILTCHMRDGDSGAGTNKDGGEYQAALYQEEWRS